MSTRESKGGNNNSDNNIKAGRLGNSITNNNNNDNKSDRGRGGYSNNFEASDNVDDSFKDDDDEDGALMGFPEEVERKVPELAAGALRSAEEEWKRRMENQLEIVRGERDHYINEAQEAQATVNGLKNTLNGVANKESVMERRLYKLEEENKILASECRELERELSGLKKNGGGGGRGGSSGQPNALE